MPPKELNPMKVGTNPVPIDEQTPVQCDADPENADWTKSTWDLQVDTVEELRALLKRENTSVEHFKTLPVRIYLGSGT